MNDIRGAQAASAALALADAVYAVLLAKRSKTVDAMLGESTGIWRDWGVGLLGGYAAVQAQIARRPTPESLGRLALLRGLCAAGHIAALPTRPRSRVPMSAALLTMNVGVSALALRARRAAG